MDKKLSENTEWIKVVHEESWAKIATKLVDNKLKDTQTEVTQKKVSMKEIMDTMLGSTGK